MRVVIYEWKPNPICNIDFSGKLDAHKVESKATIREVNDTTLDRWRKVMTEFWAVQQEMRAFRDSPQS